ncbi:MAG: ATP-binding protein [Bacteroidota bacterium]
MPLSPTELGQRLTWRYVFALALIALLATGAQVLIQYELDRRSDDATEVNLAGRQRMLSQRIAKLALASRLQTDRSETLDQLRAEVEAWTSTHEALLDGDASRGLRGLRETDFNEHLLALSAEVLAVEAAVDTFVLALDARDDESADAALGDLLRGTEAFLPAMDALVFELDSAAQVGTDSLRRIESVLYLLTLIVLALEARYVFRPAVASAEQTLGQLKEQHSLLHAIVDTVPDHIYVKDLEGRAVLRNTASAAAFPGIPPEETIGVTDAELNSRVRTDAPEEATEIGALTLSDDLRVLSTGKPLIDHEERATDGGWLLTTKVPMPDESGRLSYLVGVSRDITAAKHAQDALRIAKEDAERAKQEAEAAQQEAEVARSVAEAARRCAETERRSAEEAARMKSAFLANMSHEIRTPLNGVLGLADMLRRASLDQEEHHYAELIHASGTTLLHLLNDILDLSKIEAGRIDIESVPFDVRATMQETVRLFQTRAEKQGIAMTLDWQSGMPIQAVGDTHRVRQIVLNLVSNALKFTHEGSIAVSVHCDEEPEGQLGYHITVRDTGVGVPADKLEAIFAPFAQADASITRKYGGTGLGLAISQRLAKLMGGRVWAESEAGSGSTFHFTFVASRITEPADEPPPLLIKAARPPDDSSLRVLLAEDEPNNQIVALTMLTWLGFDADVAEDGQHALDLLAAHPYDVVLMDLHMPIVDGLEVTRRLRARGGPQPYVIAVTSAAFDSDVTACLEAGMDEHLAKPIRMDTLGEAFERARAHLSTRSTEEQVSSKEAAT